MRVSSEPSEFEAHPDSMNEMNQSVSSAESVEEQKALEEISEILQNGSGNGYFSNETQQQTAAPVPPLDGFPSFEGWGLLVSVEGIEFDYQFSKDDLHIVFQRYGRLTGVDTLAPQYPFGRVWFSKKQDALTAIRDLDYKVLNGIHGRLRVVWDPDSMARIQHQQQIAAAARKNFATNNTSNLSSVPSSSNLLNNPMTRGVSQATSNGTSSVRKYTCRIDIGIENDKDFQVARRIIGTKGCNMKKIVDVSNAKLRLRGKGSGYMEGPTQTESPEPLHICVSCTNETGYNEALKAVTEILESVYSEYRKFLQAKKRKNPRIQVPEDLKVVVQSMPLSSSMAAFTVTPGESSIEEDTITPSSPEILSQQPTPPKRYDSGYWKVPT